MCRGCAHHFVAPTNRCVNHVSIAYFCNEFWNISGIFSLKSGQKKACGGESRRRKREGSAEPSDMTLLLKLVHLSSFFPLSSWLVFSPPTQHHFQPAFTALSSHISGPLWGALVMRVHVKHFRVSATKTFFGFRFCSKKKKTKTKKILPYIFCGILAFERHLTRWSNDWSVDSNGDGFSLWNWFIIFFFLRFQ